MNRQGKIKAQVWLAILLVFLLGGVTGGALDRLLLHGGGDRPGSPRSGKGPNHMLEEMKNDLKLSEDQEKTIRGILDDSRKQFKQMAENAGFKDARERSRDRVRAVLTPEQLKRYNEMTARRDAEMKKREEADQK